MKRILLYSYTLFLFLSVVVAVTDKESPETLFKWDLNKTPPPEDIQESENNAIDTSNQNTINCAIHTSECIHWKTLTNAEKRASQRRLFKYKNPKAAEEKRRNRIEAYRALPKEEKQRISRLNSETRRLNYVHATDEKKKEMRNEKARKARIYEANRKLTMSPKELEAYLMKKRKSVSIAKKKMLVCLGWTRATTGSSLESTVAERSEMEEPVDDFGSASKWAVRRKRRHIGPLEGQIRGSLGWQPIQHKVLKASHVKTTKQRSITEEQRERIRKRKREKYASMDKDKKEKLIRKISDQQKQRIAKLSVEGRKAYTLKQNQANRRRYHRKVAIKQLKRHRTMGKEEQS